jgi:hypothetical protein
MANPTNPTARVAPRVPTQAEKDALNNVKVNSYTVVPTNVAPYGTVTATWNVTVPPSAFDIVISLNGQEVAPTGTKTITVGQQRMSLPLAAVINDPPLPFASKILKTAIVTVNTSDCQEEKLPSSVVTVPLKDAMDATFSGGGNFSLKSGGSTVTAGADGLVDIHVPITIDVPDWFDADMDIHIQLTITGADGHVFVAAPVVDPKASFSLASNLASLGCSDAVSTGMTKMAYAFLERIVDNELRPAIEQQLVAQVNYFTTLFQNNDPQHRTFVMSSLIFSANEGLLITACPQAA